MGDPQPLLAPDPALEARVARGQEHAGRLAVDVGTLERVRLVLDQSVALAVPRLELAGLELDALDRQLRGSRVPGLLRVFPGERDEEGGLLVPVVGAVEGARLARLDVVREGELLPGLAVGPEGGPVARGVNGAVGLPAGELGDVARPARTVHVLVLVGAREEHLLGAVVSAEDEVGRGQRVAVAVVVSLHLPELRRVDVDRATPPSEGDVVGTVDAHGAPATERVQEVVVIGVQQAVRGGLDLHALPLGRVDALLDHDGERGRGVLEQDLAERVLGDLLGPLLCGLLVDPRPRDVRVVLRRRAEPALAAALGPVLVHDPGAVAVGRKGGREEGEVRVAAAPDTEDGIGHRARHLHADRTRVDLLRRDGDLHGPEDELELVRDLLLLDDAEALVVGVHVLLELAEVPGVPPDAVGGEGEGVVVDDESDASHCIASSGIWGTVSSGTVV